MAQRALDFAKTERVSKIDTRKNRFNPFPVLSKPSIISVFDSNMSSNNPNLVPVGTVKRRRLSTSPPPRPRPHSPQKWHSTDRLKQPMMQESEKEQPNYTPSGLLARAQRTNKSTGAILKYAAPLESRAPPAPFRFMVFKVFSFLDFIESIIGYRADRHARLG